MSECESRLGCYTVNLLSELFPSGGAEMDLVACLEPVCHNDGQKSRSVVPVILQFKF